MHDFRESESPTPRNAGPLVLIVLFFTVLGSFMGLMMADRDALSALKTETASMIPADVRSLLNDLATKISGTVSKKDAESQAESATEDIPTGLASVSAIHYSVNADSTQLIFDLADVDLIHTGKLANPDRVYVDLQKKSRKQAVSKALQTNKEFSLHSDLIAGIRISLQEPGVMRIVLDLKKSCDFTYQIPRESPSRLIVQLQPA